MVKVLLIEDEAPVRELLNDELGVQGYEVIQAQNGEEGLQKLLDNAPDLVICDRAMPGLSGYELLARIRGHHPQFNRTPFIFLTALADPRDRAAVDHLSPTYYMTKPFDFDILIQKIKSLTDKRDTSCMVR